MLWCFVCNPHRGSPYSKFLFCILRYATDARAAYRTQPQGTVVHARWILKEREHPRGRYVPLDLVAMLDLQLREGGWGDWLFVAKQPASAPHMRRNVPHTVPRVGRSYEHFPNGFEFHLLPFSHYLQVIKRERERRLLLDSRFAILCTGGPDAIRKEAWSYYRTSSGVRLCWGLAESRGPKGRPPCIHPYRP